MKFSLCSKFRERMTVWCDQARIQDLGLGEGQNHLGGGQNFFSGVPPYGEKFHRPFGPKNTVVPPYVIFCIPRIRVFPNSAGYI